MARAHTTSTADWTLYPCARQYARRETGVCGVLHTCDLLLVYYSKLFNAVGASVLMHECIPPLALHCCAARFCVSSVAAGR